MRDLPKGRRCNPFTAVAVIFWIHLHAPMDKKANTNIEKVTRERDRFARALQESNRAFMQKVKEFSIIKRNSSLVLWNLDKKRLCLGLLEIIIDETHAENASLWLADASKQTITLTAAAGQQQYEQRWCVGENMHPTTLMMGEGIVGKTAMDGQAALIGDVTASPHFIRIESEISNNIQSILCLPIQRQGQLFGVLNLSHPEKNAFSEDDLRLLGLITDQAALAFINYYLFEEARGFHRRLEEMVTKRTRDLRRSQERFDLAVGSGKMGVWDWDISADQLYLSPNLRKMLGYEAKDLQTMQSWLRLIHPEDRADLENAIKDHLAGESDDISLEVRRFHRKGDVVWFLVQGKAMIDEQEGVQRVIGSDTDISEIKEAEERMIYDAGHDTLTGLPNRSKVLEWIGDALEKSTRKGYGFAVLCLDMDRFQIINDSLGHATGDLLIKAVSERIGLLLASDRYTYLNPRFARLGGDEFSVLVNGEITEEVAVDLARELHDCLNEPFHLQGHDIVTSISTGIVLGADDYHHPEDIMRDADAAMNRAKADGKDCHVVFKRTMFSQALMRLTLESDLRRAVNKWEDFYLVYQPIIDMKSGNVAGFEVLIRWNHPKRGLVMPGEFIGIAEEIGLIGPLGESVMLEACHQVLAWRSQFDSHFYLSVNLSPRQLLAPGLANRIRSILDETGLPPGALKMEITENVIISNFDKARSVLEDLQAMDIRLMLDDFGTGYSSLSYLHQLPLDTIKIDASFVGNLDHSPRNAAIVRTICLLAAGLGMDVVAEGVETLSHVEYLRGFACDYCQGYLFSKPLEKEDMEALLTERPCWLQYT